MEKRLTQKLCFFFVRSGIARQNQHGLMGTAGVSGGEGYDLRFTTYMDVPLSRFWFEKGENRRLCIFYFLLVLIPELIRVVLSFLLGKSYPIDHTGEDDRTSLGTLS